MVLVVNDGRRQGGSKPLSSVELPYQRDFNHHTVLHLHRYRQCLLPALLRSTLVMGLRICTAATSFRRLLAAISTITRFVLAATQYLVQNIQQASDHAILRLIISRSMFGQLHSDDNKPVSPATLLARI